MAAVNRMAKVQLLAISPFVDEEINPQIAVQCNGGVIGINLSQIRLNPPPERPPHG